MSDRWRKLLRRWGPREDIDKEFYPEREQLDQPVLLNDVGPVAAAFVGARVLRSVVARGGSLLKPAVVQKLEGLLARGLPEEAVHHCEVEAERILEWINRRPTTDEAGAEEISGEPDYDVMMAADLESRLSVADFALEEGYDLELEYFDDETSRWPRVRARLVGIENRDAADFQTALELRDEQGTFEVSLKQVRWLMPIPEVDFDDGDDSPGGDVLEFPGDVDES